MLSWQEEDILDMLAQCEADEVPGGRGANPRYLRGPKVNDAKLLHIMLSDVIHDYLYEVLFWPFSSTLGTNQCSRRSAEP